MRFSDSDEVHDLILVDGLTSATGTDISLGDVRIDASEGLVLITNQYNPNLSLPGGSISINGTGEFRQGIVTDRLGRNGGIVFLDARNDISVLNSYVSTAGSNTENGIVLIAGETIRIDSIDDRLSGVFSDVSPGRVGSGGNVRILASNLEVLNGAQIGTGTFGSGNAGNVLITVAETARFDGIRSNGVASGAFSSIGSSAEGQGGNVILVANNLEVLNGAQISASTFGIGNAGSVILRITGIAHFSSFNSVLGTASGAFSSIGGNATGAGGNVSITTASLEVLNGAQLNTSTFGIGSAGNVSINVTETARFEGFNSRTGTASGAFSSVQQSGRGQGGNIEITTENLDVINGAQLSVSTAGVGDAGGISIQVTEAARIDGLNLNNGAPSGIFAIILPSGRGRGGDIRLSTAELEIANGARLNASTLGIGNAGNLVVTAAETIKIDGSNVRTGAASGLLSNVGPNAVGSGGNISVTTTNLELFNGSQVSTSSLGIGDAGNILVRVIGIAHLEGLNSRDGSSSGIFSSLQRSGQGKGGNIVLSATSLEAIDSAQISTSSFGVGDAGSIQIEVADKIKLSGTESGVFSNVQSTANGSGGDILIRGNQLEITDNALISVAALGFGNAGSIELQIYEQIFADNGTIETISRFRSGGQILIDSNSVRLFRNSDIRTFVELGEGRGGNIEIVASSILAFGDSDILAFAQDGQGGNITLNTRAFFGENYQPSTEGIDPFSLDGNNRVDINASGSVSGVVSIPDVSFVENSLTSLPDTVVDTEQLIAGSCIARTETGGSFIVSGRGGLPDRPSDTFTAPYSTGSVLPLPADGAAAVEDDSTASWQPGDSIVEPEGLFQLPDGRVVISQRCEAE